MATLPTSLTELEAVNLMLSVIGEAPINSFSDETIDDIALARTVLDDTLKETLELGWHVNTDEEYPLTPDGDGFINLPANVARVDIDRRHQHSQPDVVQRGSRLYDRDDRTYVFTAPIKVTVIWYLAYDEVDPATKRFVAIRAARKFAERTVGAPDISGFTERDELEAKARMLEAESDVSDHNFMNEYTAARMLHRIIG